MATRRSRGDGGLSWDETRQRWVASLTVGYTPAGRRIVNAAAAGQRLRRSASSGRSSATTKTARSLAGHGYTVAQAVRDWLQFGLPGRDEDTIAKCTILANTHVIPALGARKLRELSADDVDRWLAEKAKTLSINTLANLHSILKRSVTRAQKRDKVKRNVVLPCDIPQGQAGRPSKSLNFDQAAALLDAAENTSLSAYIVVSLLTGARTEELRALPGRTSTWTTLCRASWSGARSAPAATPRPGSHAVLSNYRSAASMRSFFTAKGKAGSVHGVGIGGMTMIWCSPRAWVPHSTRGMSAARSARSPLLRVLTLPSGRRVSCGTASSRCCPTRASRSRRSPALSATPGPLQPSWSTASRSGPSSRVALRSWTSCSPGGTTMLSYSVRYSVTKGHDSSSDVMASELVGVPGLEPGTSSLSGCRHSGSDSGFTVVSWAYARSARFSYLAMSCAYTRAPWRSRADVGPTLGPRTQLWGAGFPVLVQGRSCRVRVGRQGVKQRGRRGHTHGARGRSPRVDHSPGARRPGARRLVILARTRHPSLGVHPLAVGHPPGSGLGPAGEGGAHHRLNDLRPRGQVC